MGGAGAVRGPAERLVSGLRSRVEGATKKMMGGECGCGGGTSGPAGFIVPA